MDLNYLNWKCILAVCLATASSSCANSRVVAQESIIQDIGFDIIEGGLGSAQVKVDVLIDGKAFNFQLDTGANYTFIADSPTLAPYPIIGTVQTTSAAGITLTDDKIRIRSFKIGKFEKTDFEVVRYKADSPLKNRLGVNALPDKLKFDFKNKKLTFGSNFSALASKNKLIVYWDHSFGMEINLGGVVVEAIWDTGAELSVVDQTFVDKNPKLFRHIQTITNGVDATGNPVKLELYSFESLQVAGKVLRGSVMAMNFKPIQEKMGSNIKLILGTNLIRSNNWYFDRAEKIWMLE